MIRLVPAYTLEMLDECDIERMLPYYFFDYRNALRAKAESENDEDVAASSDNQNFVIRDGKKYRKVKADQASWVDNIF